MCHSAAQYYHIVTALCQCLLSMQYSKLASCVVPLYLSTITEVLYIHHYRWSLYNATGMSSTHWCLGHCTMLQATHWCLGHCTMLQACHPHTSVLVTVQCYRHVIHTLVSWSLYNATRHTLVSWSLYNATGMSSTHWCLGHCTMLQACHPHTSVLVTAVIQSLTVGLIVFSEDFVIVLTAVVHRFFMC